MKKFIICIADSQVTAVEAISPEDFDFEVYTDYDRSLLDKNLEFLQKNSGVLVYRA